MLLFNTIHGSHLYGLAGASSDKDIFEVTDSTSPKARHRPIVDGIDVCSMGLDAFLEHIYEGSHQSLEALFSPLKVWTPEGLRYRAYLDGYRVGGSAVTRKYARTIRKFCFGDFKRRRHAIRLNYNLHSIREHGRFNPIMTEQEINVANHYAKTRCDEQLWKLLTF